MMQSDVIAGLAARIAVATPVAHDPERGRPFHAHVTLARLEPARDATAFLARHGSDSFGEGILSEVALFRSDLTAAGPLYTKLAAFPLAR